MVTLKVLTWKERINAASSCQCLKKKEQIADSKAKKVRDQQLELEKGFSKMCSTRQPAQNRPQTITQQKQKKEFVAKLAN